VLVVSGWEFLEIVVVVVVIMRLQEWKVPSSVQFLWMSHDA
jgi:hypothetical protein